MNNNISFSSGKVWLSDNVGNQITFSNCTIGEFDTPTSDKENVETIAKLSPTSEAEFICNDMCVDMPLFEMMTEPSPSPNKICFNIRIMTQARWHKKHRVNKKWRKRYGMKPDTVTMEADINIFTRLENEYDFELVNLTPRYHPDQMRRNLIMEHFRGIKT